MWRYKSMQKTVKTSRFVNPLILILVVMAVSPCFSGEKEFKGQGRKTVEKFKKTDPEITKLFNSAYGYAIFPTVGKGGSGLARLVVGGWSTREERWWERQS
jgi:hypothetical protein